MPILEAVSLQNVEAVQEALKRGEDVNAHNDQEQSLLLIATIENNVAIARLLLEHGANVNQKDRIADTPYLYAGAQGRLEILKLIVASGKVDYNDVNRYGGNTLIPAAEKGHLETVKYLVTLPEIDINFQNNFGYTALIEAVALTDGSEVYQQIVRVLLDHGADVTIRDNSGRTALDYARERGYERIASMLQ